MSFTLISVMLLTLMALTVLIYCVRGYKKGLSKSLITLASVIFSAFFGSLLAILFSNTVTDLIVGILEESGVFYEFSDLLMGFEEVIFLIIKMLAALILYVPCFYLLRLVLTVCVSLIYRKISVKNSDGSVNYYKEDEEFYVKKNKVIAACVGALSGFLTFIVIFTPATGAVKTATSAMDFAESVSGESVLGEEADAALHYISNDFSVSLVSGCGGKMLFNFATTLFIDGGHTDLNSELEALANIDFNEFATLLEFDDSSEATKRRIKKLSEDIEKSKLMKLAFVETVRGLSAAWLKGEDYMGASRPTFNSYNAVDSFINELLYVCTTTDSKTITADLNTLVNISSMLIDEQELFSSGNYDRIINALATDNILEKIKDELKKNSHMRPVLYAVDDLIMSVVAEEVQNYAKYEIEDCEQLFFEISDILTSTSNLSEIARLNAVKGSVKEKLNEYGVYVPDTLSENISSTLIEDIGSYGGDVSYDDVRQYFENFLNNGGDISDYFPMG